MTKNFICHTSYFRNYMSYYLHLWYTCLNKTRIISPGIFFHSFQNFDFQGNQGEGRGKQAKQVQSDKKFCLSHFVSQETYIIVILLHMCKMISPAIFFNFFKILIFWDFRHLNDLKLPISVCFALYLRNCRSYHRDF